MDEEFEEASIFSDDRELCEAALEGDERAIGEIQEMVRGPKLLAMLRKRGASLTEAEEIVGDLWGDCFGGERARGGIFRLLASYDGRGSLGGFLTRVAFHRLISLKRKTRVDIPIHDGGGDGDEGVVLRSAELVESEDAILEILRPAVIHGFTTVSQEKLVLFRMVQSYGISQKKVGEMWGWSESKVSRVLSSFSEELQKLIMESVEERDPWLKLEWEDFLALCGNSVDLFDY